MYDTNIDSYFQVPNSIVMMKIMRLIKTCRMFHKRKIEIKMSIKMIEQEGTIQKKESDGRKGFQVMMNYLMWPLKKIYVNTML